MCIGNVKQEENKATLPFCLLPPPSDAFPLCKQNTDAVNKHP